MSEVIEFRRKFSGLCQGGIYHKGPLIYGDDEAFLECEACKALITPMAVLKMMFRQENGWKMKIDEFKRHAKNIEEKIRTKCQHCGKMTKVNK